jgi:hypothetical protein
MVVLPDPPLGFRTTMRCMMFCHIRGVTRFAGKPTHASQLLQPDT